VTRPLVLTPPKAKRKRPRWTLENFSVPEALALADEILDAPPAKPWIERVEPRGALVARFALPLQLCSTNSSRHGMQWAHQAQKNKVFRLMALQWPVGRPTLTGRPLVRCIRFSSAKADALHDGFKIPVDCLCAPTLHRAKRRLGIIRDDNPELADVRQWWEPSAQGRGFGLIEVWTGEGR